MTSRSTLLIKQPRDKIRQALVERTWELAEFLDDIETAELIGEIEQNGSARVSKHVWRATPNIPDLLAPHVDADTFAWTAMVEWHDDEYSSQWRIEPLALKEDITCTAELNLNRAMGGRATQIAINLNLHGLENNPGVESIAYRIILVNWQKLIEATSRCLDASD